MCIGTRGDVQPYLALACALRDAESPVALFSLSSHAGLVCDAGIDFVSLGLGFDEAQATTAEGRAMKAAKGPFAARKALQAFMVAQGGQYWTATDAALRAFQPDVAVLSTIAAYFTTSLCDLHKVPFVLAHYAPFLPTKYHAPPVFNLKTWSARNPLGKALNRASWSLAMRGDWALVYRPVINHLRTAAGMAPITHGAGVYGHYGGRQRPVLLMQSPVITDYALDYPASALVTGRPEVPLPPGYTPPADVLSFLEAGPAPVCITLGSMAAFIDRPQFARGVDALLSLAVRAVTDAGARCIVFTEVRVSAPPPGFSLPRAYHLPRACSFLQGAAPDTLQDARAHPERCLLLSKGLPHSWLFPRCAAVICHGGAGTVHAAVGAGVPCIVLAVEVLWDQLWWGKQLVAAGLAPAAFKAQTVTPRQLRSAVNTCLRDMGLRARCAAAKAATDPVLAGAAAAAFVWATAARGWEDIPPL
jgi:sterol 3beta-glucosyltransferase